MTPKMRAIIVNTPNNPTGQIYPAENLAALGEILVRFIEALFAERILVVTGSGFGLGGHVRLAFCVGEKTIRSAAEGFKRAVAALRG